MNDAVKRKTGIAYFEALGVELKAIQTELGQIQGTLSLSRLQLCLILLGVCWSAIAVADIVFYSRQLWNRVQDLPGLDLLLGSDDDVSIQPDFLPSTATPLGQGDEVAGYAVTSGFGSRIPPCEGCSDYHPAIDLATPTGTAVFTPVSASVQCLGGLDDPAGNYAKIEPKNSNAPKFLLLHLDGCTSGEYGAGERIGTTGATGNGTGPHLDVRQIEDSEYVNPTKEWVEVILTGVIPTILSDAEILCAIGNAEGTLYDDCRPNSAYFGHTDPGNGAANLGAFSYQHGATTPQEADQKQLQRLRNAEAELQAQAQRKWGRSLSKAALTNALDLWNQSPAAGQDFIKHLPSADPTPQQIIDARSASYIDPATGQLDAPGLGNSADRVQEDQKRRTDEVLDVLAP